MLDAWRLSLELEWRAILPSSCPKYSALTSLLVPPRSSSCRVPFWSPNSLEQLTYRYDVRRNIIVMPMYKITYIFAKHDTHTTTRYEWVKYWRSILNVPPRRWIPWFPDSRPWTGTDWGTNRGGHSPLRIVSIACNKRSRIQIQIETYMFGNNRSRWCLCKGPDHNTTRNASASPMTTVKQGGGGVNR